MHPTAEIVHRVYARQFADLRKKFQQVSRAAFPAKLHVGIAFSYRPKLPLIFFEKGEKVNGEVLRSRVLEPILDELPLDLRKKTGFLSGTAGMPQG